MPIHYRSHRDPKSSHQQISQLVRQLGQSPVLDVGAAQGMLGKSLEGTGIVLDAVEANPEWAAMAKPYYRNVHASYIQDAPLPEKTYKTVVCADVLEHTPDPVGVLHQLRRAATDDATFIISVPNIAHLAVRLMLLMGRFPKMERGPLDRTHLQFLTKDTARQMMEQGGLRVDKFSVTGVPLDELWKNGEGKILFNAMLRAQHLALAVSPRLFGFQWIMVARAVQGTTTPAPTLQ
ncbi:MAG: Methyltransferase type 11 [Phycisphaerales bacterium]|nr:Methyltransferase type 11 [Phycisphaerales bacterium]